MSSLLIRVRLWWERATWPIPVLGILTALWLGSVATEADRALDDALAGRDIISTTASTAVLGAVGGGMVTFTGFVFSFVVLMLQFGSSQYSPRTVSYFLRARTTQVILGLFLATVTFSFLGLLAIGAGRSDYSPQATVLLDAVLLLASLIGFVVLLQSVGLRVRVDAVLSRLGRQARRGLLRRSGTLERNGWARRPLDDGPPTDAKPVQYTGRRVGQVVAVDYGRLQRLVSCF